MDLNKAGSEASTALSATWASWAVSSLTSKFYGSKISNANAVTGNSSLGNISSNPEPVPSSDMGTDILKRSVTSSAPSSQDQTRKSSEKLNHFSEKSETNDDLWGNGDGWDDDIPVVDDDLKLELCETKPASSTTIESKPSGKSGWSFDDPDPEQLIPVERRKKEPVEVKESQITREVVSNARRVKKGPMKLGAKKI